MILRQLSTTSRISLVLTLVLTVNAVHFPVIRRPQRLLHAPQRRPVSSATTNEHASDRDTRSWTRMDSKRLLAFRLLRSADRHKERSLRDVLTEHDDDISQSAQPAQTELQPDVKVEVQQPETFMSMSQLFAWAINNTVRVAAATSYTNRATPAVQKALPPATRRDAEPPRQQRRVDGAALDASVDVQQELEALRTSTESEFDVMKRSVHVLTTKRSSSRQVSALLMLEELCHSIDNGRDLEVSGGLKPVIAAMDSRYAPVRASAAWALATCCQNNPPVQRGALATGAVPLLSRLAAHDSSDTVRAKALFALNALLELEEARVRFEELPLAVLVVRNSMVHTADFRATRRALNLSELLVRRNLDAWKTMLEAWDVPTMIEKLMREHRDRDVRESAARTIAALDGRSVA